jgi:hypothetical protein
VALDLDRQLVGAKVDRMDEIRRGVPRAQGHALEVQGDLRHLRIGDRRVSLLEHLHLEFGQLRHLLCNLPEALGDVLAQLL